MAELQPFGMEVQAVGGLSVEGVAYDGAVQAFRVGGVYTKLVGSAGLGIESHAGSIVYCIHYFIACNCRLAVFVTDHLQGTVVEVGTEGQTDEAFRFGLWNAFEQGDVAFLHGSSFELFLEQGMGILVLGCQEQAGGGHVEAVNEDRAGGIGVPFLKQGEHGGLTGFAGYGEHAGGFVDHQQEVVFVHRLELGSIGVRGEERIGLYLQSLQHEVQDGFALVSAGGVVVPVTADFALGRVSPPEFGHGKWLEVVQVGVLQQLGGSTFACSGRWVAVSGLGKDAVDVLFFTACVT